MNKRTKYAIGIALSVLVISLFYVWLIPKTSKPETVRLAYVSTSIDYAPFYIASAKGFFAERGVTIEPVPFGSGNEARLALSTGQVDLAFGGPVGWFVLFSKGIPIKMLAPMDTFKSYLYVRPGSKIKTFKDLVGKTIAFQTLGSGDEYDIRHVLKLENVNANEVNFVKMERAYRPIALMDGTIDAVKIDQSEVPTYLKAGAVIHEEWAEKGYDKRYIPGSLIVVYENFKKSHPKMVNGFIDAIIEGNRFLQSNPEESAEIVASYIKNESAGAISYTPENLVSMWKNEEVKYTLWYDPMTIVNLSEVGVELGQLKSALTLDQLYDLSYEQKLKDAQNEIYSAD